MQKGGNDKDLKAELKFLTDLSAAAKASNEVVYEGVLKLVNDQQCGKYDWLRQYAETQKGLVDEGKKLGMTQKVVGHQDKQGNDVAGSKNNDGDESKPVPRKSNVKEAALELEKMFSTPIKSEVKESSKSQTPVVTQNKKNEMKVGEVVEVSKPAPIKSKVKELSLEESLKGQTHGATRVETIWVQGTKDKKVEIKVGEGVDEKLGAHFKAEDAGKYKEAKFFNVVFDETAVKKSDKGINEGSGAGIFNDASFYAANFNNCEFKNVDFSKTKNLDTAKFVNCKFVDVDFSKVPNAEKVLEALKKGGCELVGCKDAKGVDVAVTKDVEVKKVVSPDFEAEIAQARNSLMDYYRNKSDDKPSTSVAKVAFEKLRDVITTSKDASSVKSSGSR